MAEIGQFNELAVLSLSSQGAQLDGGDLGEILLPAAEVPSEIQPGERLKVFVYPGVKDVLMATRTAPAAEVGQVAWLKIVRVTDAGAFLAWGLPKDLLLPWDEVTWEQKKQVREGRHILVFVFQAADGRIAASARLNDFLQDGSDAFQEGEAVCLMVAETTDLGLRVIVNHKVWGLVHRSDLFGSMTCGQTCTGYVKALRSDRKLNLALSAPGYGKVAAVSQKILAEVRHAGGFLAMTDKTAPEIIYSRFGISKKAFKLALAALYRERRIALEPDGIRMVGPVPELDDTDKKTRA